MPRDTLTRDQIVRAAVELLDAEGLDGLNMRALGKRLDSAATAVYWHVKNKDDLILLATDLVWGELRLPDPDAADWRTATTAMATDLHGMFTRHPWLVQVFATHLVYGHGKARHDDHGLAVHEAAGFTADEADQAAAAVFTYVLGNATGAAATASLTRRFDEDQERFHDALDKAREVAAHYPRLRARLGTPAATGYAASPDESFELGLQALLDGLERRLDRRASVHARHG
ncbi:TetR/AcrR family transcriptional regulator [Saccharothrix syringae]|uniref:TetR family transcriptional regulator n=1 Tax=Saccharothrix syringae TaxID=103733 RepID=A0A5Q0GV25_SACSY|nr:TetR/AcrR family transcriptional regulator C-terminal domain-containing protein [Saccharothrix syringae]QFZ17330.1 TetR family transcriptional regulator [Saccharothrix syringae]